MLALPHNASKLCCSILEKVADRPEDQAKWGEIADVVAALSIPVIANAYVFEFTTNKEQINHAAGSNEIMIAPPSEKMDVLPPMQSKEIMEDNSASGSASTETKLEILIAPPNEKRAEIETRNRHFRLYQAALEGDWHTAEIIFKEHKNDITAKLSKEGDTALHIAAAARRTTFVKKLVEKMKKEDLAIKNNAGNTAFFLAAASNRVAIVKAMMEQNEDLRKNKGENDMLPLVMAARMGNKEMIEYLYEATEEELLDDSERCLSV
ncbi:uncharacterized protein LOC123219764 [Mangifera indica]|uniref:uncharacterized protein LOC123219764 n=1 Tax=Mangifera indica TaxID=29780 RepID=UPI001CF9C834|nr:uncharacterized protein LOC123219764 [Mangifera indica]